MKTIQINLSAFIYGKKVSRSFIAKIKDIMVSTQLRPERKAERS
jgi:hypothetical protein